VVGDAGPEDVPAPARAGAMIMIHVNDGFFWVVTGFSKMDVASGYRTVSVLSAVMGLTAFAVISFVGPLLLGL